MTSPKNSFKGTAKKMLISCGLALLGAFATWLLTITNIFDFGIYAPIIGSFAGIAANAIKEFIQERQ